MLDYIPLVLVFLAGMGAGVGIWWVADTLESRHIEFPYFSYPDITPTDEEDR